MSYRYGSCREEPGEMFELKKIKPATEISLDGINSQLGTREERIRDVEDRSVEIIQTERRRVGGKIRTEHPRKPK